MGHGFRVVTPEGIRHHDEMIRDIGPRKTKERMRTARKKFFLAGIHRGRSGPGRRYPQILEIEAESPGMAALATPENRTGGALAPGLSCPHR